MCDTAINRRNIVRTVRDEDITGRTLARCAVQIAQQLGHPGCGAAVEAILSRLVREGRIALHDAQLRLLSDEERVKIIGRSEALARRRRRRVRRRATTRRTASSATSVGETRDPDWDPESLSLEEEELGFWCACTSKLTPRGGWAEFHPDTPPWDRKLLDACFPEEACI